MCGNVLETLFFINITISEFDKFEHFGEDAARKMMKTRLNKSWKSWIWDQDLPENMKWFFGNNTKKLRNQEPKKLRNQETKKLRDRETQKLRNQETKKLRDQGTDTNKTYVCLQWKEFCFEEYLIPKIYNRIIH